MTESLMQRALQRSAEYNISLSEAIDQIYQMDHEAQMRDDFDARQEEILFPALGVDGDYDHVERDHDEEYIPEDDDGWSDVEADADTLASAGMGTDEDYGCFGGDEC